MSIKSKEEGKISGIDTISATPGTEHLMKSDKSDSVNCRCSEIILRAWTLERKFILDTIRILI